MLQILATLWIGMLFGRKARRLANGRMRQIAGYCFGAAICAAFASGLIGGVAPYLVHDGFLGSIGMSPIGIENSLSRAITASMYGAILGIAGFLMAFLQKGKRANSLVVEAAETRTFHAGYVQQEELVKNAPPLNPLPPVVWALALPLIAMEVVVSLAARGLVGGAAGVGWRVQAMERFAFSPDLMRAMVEQGNYPPEALMRLVTYPLVHGTFTHTLFVVVILLALGKMVGEVFRWWGVVAVVLGAAAVAALVYTALLPGVRAPLIGGFPAVYGLIGAFTFLIWVRLVGTGANRLRAFTMIGFLLGAQLLFGALFGGGWEWVADLAGFATGFALSFVVSPGGFARVRAMLRQR